MFRSKTHRAIPALTLGFLSLSTVALSRAATPHTFSGSLGGVVRNSQGIPQMGATVVLYNRQERVFEKVLTDERGEFRFVGLAPDIYSVRVTLASFVPALRNHILVQPGMRSLLNVNLNTLFSSIQIAYPPLDNGSLMTDDWKWMLRSASATRPVLRFAGESLGRDLSHSTHPAVFSDTRGILQLSAGDSPVETGIGS